MESIRGNADGKEQTDLAPICDLDDEAPIGTPQLVDSTKYVEKVDVSSSIGKQVPWLELRMHVSIRFVEGKKVMVWDENNKDDSLLEDDGDPREDYDSDTTLVREIASKISASVGDDEARCSMGSALVSGSQAMIFYPGGTDIEDEDATAKAELADKQDNVIAGRNNLVKKTKIDEHKKATLGKKSAKQAQLNNLESQNGGVFKPADRGKRVVNKTGPKIQEISSESEVDSGDEAFNGHENELKELTSLTVITALFGLHATLPRLKLSKDPEQRITRSRRSISAAWRVDMGLNAKEPTAEAPRLDQFLMKKSPRLKREVREDVKQLLNKYYDDDYDRDAQDLVGCLVDGEMLGVSFDSETLMHTGKANSFQGIWLSVQLNDAGVVVSALFADKKVMIFDPGGYEAGKKDGTALTLNTVDSKQCG